MNDNNPKEIISPVVSYIFKKKVIKEEFLLAATSFENAKQYWQSFPFKALIIYGQLLIAYREVSSVLSKCRSFSEIAYKKIHKGNPYYWLGYSSFLLNNFETAAFFMAEAAKEDLNLDKPNYPSPATDFIELLGESENQAAKPIVEKTELKLNDLIQKYNDYFQNHLNCPTIDIENIRDWFLRRATKTKGAELQTLATTLISYILEFEHCIDQWSLVDIPNSKEPFLLHLFKGCLLLESLLKENPIDPQITPRITLGPILQNLYSYLGIRQDTSISVDNLQEVINTLPGEEKSIQTAFEISGKIRNTVGHSLGWVIDLTIEQYKKMFELIGICCIHSIVSLYKK